MGNGYTFELESSQSLYRQGLVFTSGHVVVQFPRLQSQSLYPQGLVFTGKETRLCRRDFVSQSLYRQGLVFTLLHAHGESLPLGSQSLYRQGLVFTAGYDATSTSVVTVSIPLSAGLSFHSSRAGSFEGKAMESQSLYRQGLVFTDLRRWRFEAKMVSQSLYRQGLVFTARGDVPMYHSEDGLNPFIGRA